MKVYTVINPSGWGGGASVRSVSRGDGQLLEMVHEDLQTDVISQDGGPCITTTAPHHVHIVVSLTWIHTGEKETSLEEQDTDR